MNAILKDQGAYGQLEHDQRAFVNSYVDELRTTADAVGVPLVNMLNAPITAAAIEASAGLLNLPTVKAAIVERVYSLANEVDLTVFAIVRELKAIAFASLEDAFTIPESVKGEELSAIDPVLDLTRMTSDQWRAIKSYEKKNGQFTNSEKVQQHDKLKAIELLGKYMKIFDPDNDEFRRFQARNPETKTIAANDTIEDAQALYAQMIESI